MHFELPADIQTAAIPTNPIVSNGTLRKLPQIQTGAESTEPKDPSQPYVTSPRISNAPPTA
jgi:hypothetical protein